MFIFQNLTKSLYKPYTKPSKQDWTSKDFTKIYTKPYTKPSMQDWISQEFMFLDWVWILTSEKFIIRSLFAVNK